MTEQERETMIDELLENYQSTQEFEGALQAELESMEDEAIAEYIADDLEEDMQSAFQEYRDNDEIHTTTQVRQECIDNFIENCLDVFVDRAEAKDNVLEIYSDYLGEQDDEDLITIYNRELKDN